MSIRSRSRSRSAVRKRDRKETIELLSVEEQSSQHSEVHDLANVSSETFTMTWKDIGLKVKDKTTKADRMILSQVSGVARPGEILAIMGPSGSGKTTLLNVISGRAKETEGTVLVNGLGRKEAGFKYISSFVHQEDALIASLTVRETIEYTAKLRLPHTMGKKEINMRINSAIVAMGLERVQNSLVGNVVLRGISGGEKRRLAIANELVTSPKILIMDEPTSGLDSEASHQVLKHLVEFAKTTGTTIVLTIHQPSSLVFNTFDQLCLLTLGRLAYFGAASGAAAHFEAAGKPVPPFFNPSDHFLSVLNKDFESNDDSESPLEFAEGFAKVYKSSEIYTNMYSEVTNIVKSVTSPVKQDYANPSTYQMWVLLQREIRGARRNLFLYWIRAAMYVAMGILMGTTWFNLSETQEDVSNRISAHFFSVAFLCFMSVASIPGVIEANTLFWRERENGTYSLSAWIIANFIISTSFNLLLAIIFTTIAYPLMNLNPDFYVAIKFLLVLFLSFCTVDTIVIVLSASLPIFVVSLALTAFLNGLFMVAQGFFVSVDSLPSFWLWAHYWSYQKYSFEALMVNEFDTLTFSCGEDPAGIAACFCSYSSPLNAECKFTGKDVLLAFGYEDVDFWAWIGVLIGQVILYRIILYVVLSQKLVLNH